ncbi:MAG: TetR/AcrR family transcriptional regulator [Bacilli bacterium]|nr:TetR/AcrR family transcriptional regulator [Bacilli bacterium]
MNTKNTYDKIIDVALNLFSVKGLSGVSLDEIAKGVGIKTPSLYKHFKNKEEIFDVIVERMSERYNTNLSQISTKFGIEDANKMKRFNESKLLDFGSLLFQFLLRDKYISKFRRLLTIEQFSNKRANYVYLEELVNSPLSLTRGLFSSLSREGKLKDENPDILSLEFYSSLLVLLITCDGSSKKEKPTLQLLQVHIRSFYKNHFNRN